MHVDTEHSKVASTHIASVSACPFCNQQSDDLTKLKQHIESVHCNKNSTSSDYQESIRIERTETCFKCQKCTSFGSKMEMEEHRENEHMIPEAFPCEF